MIGDKMREIRWESASNLINAATGSHYFSRDTLKFFRGRLPMDGDVVCLQCETSRFGGTDSSKPSSWLFIDSIKGPHDTSPRTYQLMGMHSPGSHKGLVAKTYKVSTHKSLTQARKAFNAAIEKFRTTGEIPVREEM